MSEDLKVFGIEYLEFEFRYFYNKLVYLILF